MFCAVEVACQRTPTVTRRSVAVSGMTALVMLLQFGPHWCPVAVAVVNTSSGAPRMLLGLVMLVLALTPVP